MSKHAHANRNHKQNHNPTQIHNPTPAQPDPVKQAKAAELFLFPGSPSALSLEDAFMSFWTWPMQWFGMMMAPWQKVLAEPSAPLVAQQESEGTAMPRSTNTENDKEYIYTIELPGVERNQISLTFQNKAIMLEVREDGEKETLRRAFPLPVYTDATKIDARLSHGKLHIHVPKAHHPMKPQSREIEVK